MKSLLLKLWQLLPLSRRAQLTLLRLINDEFLVGTTGIIFNERNEVLLFKHTYRSIPWSLPGGYLQKKEHPREGLAREIEEESGLIVSIDRRMKIRTDRRTARLDICYIGTYLGGIFQESSEVNEAKFFSFTNLPLISRDQVILIEQALESVQKPMPAIPFYKFFSFIRPPSSG